MLKRLTSLLLTAVMLLTMLPGTAVAAEPKPLEGKKFSVLGASISTYAGTSNGAAADTTNSTIRSNAKYYPNSTIPEVTLNDTWWTQVCEDLGMELLVNNAWSGSAILLERSGTVGAYVDRCVQLHDDTGANAGEEPDIICIQMGFNDFSYGKSTLGTADIDYDALITADGYGTPATTMEATAVMLDKMVKRYPNAEIYMFNHFKRINQSAADTVLMENLNASIEEVCGRFGVTVVDLYHTLTEPEHIGDGNLHPNRLGMDVITEAVKTAILSNHPEAAMHTVSLELDGATADYGADRLVADGDSFTLHLTASAGDALNVSVTMGGEDITDACCADGTVSIDAVTADVIIAAESVHESKGYRWEFDGTDLVSVTAGGNEENTLTKNAGTTTDGVFSTTRYALETPVFLSHEEPWVVEWQSEGTWQNTSGSGGRMFTSDDVNAHYNARYIFKSSVNGLIAMGEKTTSGSHNYGVALGDYGIDWTEPHTYRLENRIAGDGSNMIWLFVDGVEIGPMTQYHVGTTDKNTTSDWLSGKDFVFPYMGTDSHGFTNCSIDYIQVWEAGEPELSFAGKSLSILGDSISTYSGVSNSTAANATLSGSAVYYSAGTLGVCQADTWWQQAIDVLGLELLVNNSWSGSCILPTRSGTAGAYQNRCVQLHNDKTGEEPDIIAVFLGTNDFSYYQSTLGTADIDYASLITENSDGTYAYAEPTTSCEAYAIMLHKMTERYPDAEIYCMTLLPRRATDYTGDSITDVGQPTAFNAELEQVITHFDATVVDLEHCGITSDAAAFDLYMGDKRVHPNAAGMDKMTEALVRALTDEETTLCNVTLNLNHVTANNEAHMILSGEAYSNTLHMADGYENLKVTVTMGGADITETCVSNGVVRIPDVTGDIVITSSATVDKDPESYRWEFNGTELVSVTTGDNVQNTLTKLAGTCDSGTLKNARYQLAEEVVLSPDQPWVVEWECSGDWSGMLLSSHGTSGTKGMNYLFRTFNASKLLAFGEYTGSQYANYGMALADSLSDPDANHVYRVENRIAADGSNMAYLQVDGVELGAMDDYYIAGTSNQNRNVAWVDGNTFVFGYIGSTSHPLQGMNLKYLQVWEDGEPAGEDEPVDLFVFAGQSNMMGAAVLEPETDTFTDKALEYKYMPKLRGAETGSFVAAQNPAGEFHYKNLNTAYGDKLNDLSYKSALTDYSANTYFCPAMRNETKGFAAQSEADTYPGASLPPYFVTEYADYGHSSVYAHMAKGSVKITYYFTEEMATRYNALIAEYNAQNGSVYPALNLSGMSGAGDAFDNEYNAMLEDYAEFAPDGDVENRCFVWLQGEGDAGGSYIEYKLKMQVLWEHLQELGFSHFFVLRVGYWGNAGIRNVIKAQEDFCAENDNCYIVTRAPSLIPYPGATTDNWWISEPDAEYDDCRDSYVVNSGNHHFNEKAFRLFAERSAENVHRILHLGQEPILEEENIQGMPTEQPDEDETPYTSYVGAEIFRNSLSVSKPAGTWTEQAQSSAASTDLIPVKSTDSVWLQYVFFKSEAHAVGGFYDADGNLVAPLYYKQFGFTLDGNTGGVSAFQTPEATNRVSIAEVEEATGKEIAFVRFTAWKASAGGHANTEARIYHEAEKLSLRYDDHYDVSGKTVEIVDAGKPTSYQVGYGVGENTVRDTAVVTLKGDTLVATGIGTAQVKLNGVTYVVTVETAPISLLLLAGQSNMRGSEGNAAQSIVCPDGMVYATYGDDRGADNVAMTVSNAAQFAPSALTGAYSTINTEGTTECLSGYPVYSLTEAGAGKIGPDSGFAYEWVQQTGEKVWVVNAAHGGTSINVWQPDTTEYEQCQALFTACQETLRKEIAAGHYTLSHMAYFWCQGCSDRTQTAAWYVNKYLTMHESLKTELAFDHDSDPATAEKTFEFGGIIPVRVGSTAACYRDGVNSDANPYAYHESFVDLRMSGPRVAQYWMGSNPELEDIWNVCTIGEDWVWMPDGTNGVSDYFRKHYPNGTVDYTTQAAQTASWYTPTTPKAVHDSIHYNQIGYNEIGRESVRNALIMMGVNEDYDEKTTVEFVNWTGYQPAGEIAASTTGRSGTLVVPMVSPITRCKDVTYTSTDGLTYKYYDLLADSGETTGTLTAVGANSASVNVVKQAPGALYANHLSQLPDKLCKGMNLWSVLEHDPLFYSSGTHWGTHSSGTVYSVTIPVQPGDKLYATAWGKAGENGHATSNGIRVTFFGDYDVVKTMDPAGTYAEFSANGGYLVAPEGATAVNIPMWTNEDSNEIYILSRAHDASGELCSICGKSSHEHSWSEWQRVTLPTASAQGVEQRTCACGETEERKVDGVWQKYALSDYLQELPEHTCCDTNLWAKLEHNPKYFANGVNWGVYSGGSVCSVTIPVTAGEKVYASSFGKAGENGHASSSGIRTTFFDAWGVAKTMTPAQVYAEFSANGGYLVAPEGAIAVNIAMWTSADTWELYLPDREHQYTDGICTGCGEVKEALQGSIRLRSGTLNLLDKICIIYKASDDLLPTNEEDVAERGVLLYDSAEKAASKDPALAYETVKLEYDPAEGRFVGQTEGIDARDMGKSQFAVAYVRMADGTVYYGTKDGTAQAPIEYSPLIYCRNKKTDPEISTLCRAMMQYGAAAQVAQYANPGPLMNEGFAAVAYDESVLGETVLVTNTAVINGMRLRSATMDLKGAISYIVKYSVEDAGLGDKQLYAEYTIHTERKVLSGEVALEPGTDGRLWATISGVPPKDIGAKLTVRPYYLDESGNKVYGGELVYSGYEYVRRAQTNTGYDAATKELAKALAMYVHYANIYGYSK